MATHEFMLAKIFILYIDRHFIVHFEFDVSLAWWCEPSKFLCVYDLISQFIHFNMSTECRHQYPYSLVWTIENIILCPLRPGEKLCSPSFVAERLRNTKWRLVLYPKGTKNLRYMSLFLQREVGNPQVEEIVVNFKLFMNSFVPRFRFLKGCRNVCFRENELAGFSEFARLKTIHLLEDSSPSGIFTIHCELSASDETSRDSTWNKRTDLKTLSQNIESLYESKLHCDAILYSGDFKFHIHKAVLAARAPKLLQNLAHQDRSVPIAKNTTTISSSILGTILFFLYTGKLDIPSSVLPQQIFDIAEQYELTELLQKMLTCPKAFQAHTVLEVEHKFVMWDVRIVNRGEGDTLSYVRILPCEMVYIENLIISCKIVNDNEIENYASVSFRLTGVNPDRPVSILCNVHCHINEDTATDLFAAYHLFKTEEEWKRIFSISEMFLGPYEFLHLSFEIDLCDGATSTYLQEKMTFPDLCPLGVNDFDQFSMHFGRLLSSGTYSDFTIFCGGETFEVHKAILSARSPVFERMLKHDMMEKRLGSVEIPDISPDVIKLMLSYMYSGMVEDLTHEEACALYEAADKYEIIILKERCAFILKMNLNEETVRSVIDLAYLHFDHHLKYQAKKFIYSHKIKVGDTSVTIGKTNVADLPSEPLDLTVRKEK